MSGFDLTGLDELNGPVTLHRSPEFLELVAPARTDLFCPPDGGAATLNAPALLAQPPEHDFLLSTHIEAELRSTFDAGALLLWHDEQTWAKLALERSPEGRSTIVSVVTRARSRSLASDTCSRSPWAEAESSD